MLPHHIPIQHFNAVPTLPKFVRQQFCQRRLARRGQAREPHREALFWSHHFSRYAFSRMAATSERVNSRGSSSPLRSSSRTFVPLRTSRCSDPCAQVFSEEICPHSLQ